MRAPVGWLLAGLLWGLGLWWGGVPVVPWELTVRPAPGRALPAAAAGLRVLQAEVTTTLGGLTGLALGDAVQFDRYGVLPPVRGARRCVPFFGVQVPVLTVTPLGGEGPHVPPVTFTVVDAGSLAGCDPAGLVPVVSGHP